MNTISGRIILKESGVGIPDLLVILYNDGAAVPAPPSAPPAGTATAIANGHLCSVLTGSDGSFTLNYDDSGLQMAGARNGRAMVRLSVLAPEEPGISPDALLLYSSVLPRQASPMEGCLIRLTTAQLQKAGIPLPSETPEDFEPSANIVGRLNALAARQNDLVNGAIGAAKGIVEAHRTRVASFDKSFKPTLQKALSKLPTSPIAPERIVGPGESVFTKSSTATVKSVQEVVNSDDPAKRAPARGFISLTADQVTKLKAQVAADGTVPASAVAAAVGPKPTTTYVQALDRLPLCQPSTPHVDCTDSILNPQPPANNPTPPADGDAGPITMNDVPRFLGRLMEPLTAPEEALVTGLMPVATRDSVQNSIQSFVFDPSPADAPAFHDFNNLQIAFDYVWQEAIDQGALDLAKNAYETILGLGGTPDHPDYKGLHPVRALAAEAKLILNAHATPTVVVRDHRGEAPGTRVAPPPSGGVTVTAGNGSSSTTSCPFAAAGNVRDHRAGVVDPMSIADPIERLPALLEALNKKLLENYNFTIYAANDKERSVNFGILNTFRQFWTPLSYQAGRLVKSIPLAPKQTQKVVITHKTTKKRAQKEIENNLKVLKEETSETNRAEQQIANKASMKSSYSVENQAKGDMEVGSDTATTSFKLDAEKTSEDVKKSFHEAVFKSAQEFKQEKTTEVSTEQTSEFESVETTEITNPNDEIAVTFLFYELQRRYRIYERLYRVQPVVLVAQEFPQPGDIDQAWLVRHDWILRRVILDDSYLPVLDTIAQTSGDKIALEEMQVNVNQQRCIVNELRQELAIASQQATMQRALMDQATYVRSGASSGGLLGAVENLAGDVAGAVGKVGDFILGGNADQNDSNRQALQDRANEAADAVRDLMFRLEREVTALNSLTEAYTKALREHNNHLTEIARLQVHVKDNIMYYMQAIWAHEPADQRFFRLHNTPVPDLAHSSRGFRVQFENALATTMAPPHQVLARFGGRDVKVYPLESVTKFNPQITYKPLSQVADLGNLLGFKGNYAIFPLYESNPLTDFMMDPYVDRATGQLVDPSDPLNWSLDEFSQYVCCLKKKLTNDEFQQLLPQLQTMYQKILSNPLRDDDVLIVPTNSMFIEALPATHTLLERFKLDHRMIDVKKAQAETREKELDNVRMAARILSGERGDPHIDKKILIEGGENFVVPTGDQ
jgi:hypothetical protein